MKLAPILAREPGCYRVLCSQEWVRIKVHKKEQLRKTTQWQGKELIELGLGLGLKPRITFLQILGVGLILRLEFGLDVGDNNHIRMNYNDEKV